MVRGKDVLEAMDVLKFETSKATIPVSKVIASAVANAEENFGVSRDDLFIHRIFADTGPTRRWRRFGARGRFKPWLRRSSHITVILRERDAF
jgi:large subunit ribosomal protein L22